MSMRAETAGHILQGTLGDEDVRALFERCASLRFTGMLELTEGPRRTAVPFVEGEPLDGPDLFKLGAVWRRGSYRLVQRVVDFLGNLTDDVVLSGQLRDTPPMQLFRHCEDGRLSAEIFIVAGDGQKARVRFGRGRLETAEVNGQPSMGALATLGGWSAGSYRLVLAPLFDGSAPPPPPPSAGRAPSGPQSRVGLGVRPVPSDVFDITAKVPLWQVDGDDGAGEAAGSGGELVPPRPPSPSGPPTMPSIPSRMSSVPPAPGEPSGERPSAPPSLFTSARPTGQVTPVRPGAAPATPARSGPSFARTGGSATPRPGAVSSLPPAPTGTPARPGSGVPSFSARPITARSTVIHTNPPMPPATSMAPPPASGWELPEDPSLASASAASPPAPPEAEPPPRLEPAVSLPPRFAASKSAPATIQDMDIESLMRHVSEFGELPIPPASEPIELTPEPSAPPSSLEAASLLAPPPPAASMSGPPTLELIDSMEAPPDAAAASGSPTLDALEPQPSMIAEAILGVTDGERPTQATPSLLEQAFAQSPGSSTPPDPPAAEGGLFGLAPEPPPFGAPSARSPSPPPVPSAPPPPIPNLASIEVDPSLSPLTLADPPPAVPSSRPSSSTGPVAAVGSADDRELADLFPSAAPMPAEPDPPGLPTAEPAPPVARKGSSKTWIGVVGALGAAAAAYALWPAPPPPAPPPQNTIVTVAPPPPTTIAANPTAGSTRPTSATPSPTVTPPSATPTPTAAPATPSPGPAFEKFILAARKATLEGDKKLALKMFKGAFLISPKDPAFDRYVPMTLGKTGRGTVVLEGKGTVSIDGHPFAAPRKVPVPAGPHLVVVGKSKGEVMVGKDASVRIAPASGNLPPGSTPLP